MVRMNFDPSLIASSSDINNEIFHVYPNPSNGKFTISVYKNARYDVIVNNVLGQTIFTGFVSEMNTVLDLSNFGKGIYTIELRNQDKIFTDQVIVE